MRKFKCDNKELELCMNSLNTIRLHFLMKYKEELILTPLDISEFKRYISMSNSTALYFAAELKEKYHTKFTADNITSWLDIENLKNDLQLVIKLNLLTKKEINSFILSSYDELANDHINLLDPTSKPIQFTLACQTMTTAGVHPLIVKYFIQLVEKAIQENDYPFPQHDEVDSDSIPISKKKLIALGCSIWSSFQLPVLSLCKQDVDDYLTAIEAFENYVYSPYLVRREIYTKNFMQKLEKFFYE